MSVAELLFAADAIVAIMTAAVVILHRNAVVSAVSLVLHLCSMAVFFLLLDASFLFAVQIILYAGAIMVLFLFVIMLLDPAGTGVGGRPGRTGRMQLVLTIAGAFLLLAGMAKTVTAIEMSQTVALPDGFGSAAGVGRLLFTDYLFPFEVASFLLLVAMIGALHMGKRELD
ncbi:MAG: NADH-quinone oxidoreductase subunit J [Acidobacteriota bacterium]